MLQLLVDGCQKARMLRPRHRMWHRSVRRHNTPARDRLTNHGVRCAAATVCGLVCNRHHHFAVNVLGRAQLDARRCLRKAENLTERQAVARNVRPQGKALQCNLRLAAERLFCCGPAAVEVGTRQAPVDKRLAHCDTRALQTMVAVLLQAAARDAAPRRVRYHADSTIVYAQAHDGQYACRTRRIETSVVAGRTFARDEQHISVRAPRAVRIFHHIKVVIEHAVALHVALAKPKGEVNRCGGGPYAVRLRMNHQT